MKKRMDMQRENNYYMSWSEWLDTTGVSDLASARGHEGTMTNSMKAIVSFIVLSPLPRASENCILLAPLNKCCTVYIPGLLLRMCASFVVWHPSLS